jgi:inner membrane protein involved in colicin E2 resistance
MTAYPAFTQLYALASFAAAAALMYLTCRLDWCGTFVPAAAAGPTPKEPV